MHTDQQLVSTGRPSKRSHGISSLFAGALLAAVAAIPLTASAWTEIWPDSDLQVQDADGTYHNQSGTVTSINYGDVRYSNSGGIETYQVVGLAQKRVERRYHDDYYSTTSRRWESHVLFNSPSGGVTIHQLFNGSAGPHVLYLTSIYTGGSLKVFGWTPTTTVATGVYGVWTKIESKNRNTGIIEVLINGSVVLTGSRRSGDYYTKYGMYNPNAAQTIQFKDVHIYQ